MATRVASPDAGIDYLKLDYMIPPGTAAGFYAKAFPAALRADQIDVVRLAVKAEEPDQARQITAAIEIKGTAGLQRIPLEIRSDWIPVEQTIDWPVIGTVREVVLLVNSISDRAARVWNDPDRRPVRSASRAPEVEPIAGGTIRRRPAGKPDGGDADGLAAIGWRLAVGRRHNFKDRDAG